MINLLPTSIIKADNSDPRKLFLFAHTKVGKTSSAAQLPNSLLIDLEEGSGYVDAQKINIRAVARDNGLTPLQALGAVVKQIKEANIANGGKPKYDFIIVDTTTAMEDIARKLATTMYIKSPVGKNFDGTDVVTELSNGAGYTWLRLAFDTIYSSFNGLAGVCIIFLGHVKLASINKNGADFQARDIDLTGKLKAFVCADVTSIGYMYRDSEDPYKTILSFETNELDLSTGSRSSHLRQKKFVISILNKETNVLTTDWEQIFPNAFKNYKK